MFQMISADVSHIFLSYSDINKNITSARKDRNKSGVPRPKTANHIFCQ